MKELALTYANMVEKLPEAIPELKARLEEERAWLKEDLQYILYEHVFYEHIEDVLKNRPEEQDHVVRLFDFLDYLLRHESYDVRDVAEQSVIEPICCDEVVLQRAQKYMSAAAKKSCAAYLGHK